MKLTDQTVEKIEQEDLFKHIELCGRVCYKSEKKITDTSNVEFVNMLLQRKHYSPLEHGTVYLEIPEDTNLMWKFVDNPYTKVKLADHILYVTTNYRVIIENGWSSLYEKYKVAAPTKHLRRYTFRIIASRAIIDELRTHRSCSFCVESTRYVKYNNEMLFLNPHILNRDLPQDQVNEICMFYNKAENMYNRLLAEGVPPQIARDVLPLGIKSEMILTAFGDDLEELYNKRTVSGAHPHMKELMNQFKNFIYGNNEDKNRV